MTSIKKQAWIALMLRGIISVIFGAFALFYPTVTFSVLIMLIGIYVCINGLLTIVMSFSYLQHDHSWCNYLLQGIISLIIGIMIITWPGITAIILLIIIAAWIIIMGVIEIIAYINLSQLLENNIFLIIAGILSILIGLYFIRFPTAGIVALVWLIGIYALVAGILSILAALKIKKT